MDTLLESGLRCLVDPVPNCPVVAVYLWVKAGSADEGPDEEGAAHFVEHMLFKGTDRRSVGDVAAEIEGLGGDINAFTSFDETVYHATVPASAWERALDVVADMVFNSRFEAAEIELERRVILDELRGGDDDPSRALADAINARLFTEHPYGRPVIGRLAAVRRLSPQSLRVFFERYYRPSNMILSVSGDVEPERVAAAAHRLVADRGPAPERAPRPVEPQPRRRRSVQVEDRFDEALVEVAFRGVHDRHPDAAALDLLSLVLGSGPASLLGRRLRLEQGLVADAWGAVETEADDGLLVLGCAPFEHQVGKALPAMLSAIEAARRGHGLDPAALERARAQVVAARRQSRETADGRAHDRAWYAARWGRPEAEAEYRAAIEAVDVAALRRVAAFYLDPARSVVGVLAPTAEMDPAAFRVALGSALPPVEPCPPPRLRREHLSNGLTVVIDPSDSGEMVGLRVVGLGGQLAEPKEGLAEAWSRVVGPAGMDALDLAEWMDARGAEFSAFNGRSSHGLRLDLASDRALEGLELILGMLSDPGFDPEEHARTLREIDDDERLIPDNPSEQAAREAAALLFGQHPYGRPLAGNRRQGLTRRALQEFHRSWMVPSKLVLAVSGPVDGEALLRRLRRWSGPAVPCPCLPERPSAAFPAAHIVRRIPSDRDQAHVVVSWPGARLGEPEAEVLQVAAEILGSQGGRLFLALRDQAGLGYAVGAESVDGWDPGHFSLTMSTPPEHAEAAREGLRAEVARLAAEGPGAEELERVKTRLLGGFAMNRQRAGARAGEFAAWERFGWEAGTLYPRMERAVRRVDASAVREVLSRALTRHGGVEVVVGAQTSRRRRR